MAADSAVQVVRAAERSTETQQTSGMTREVAVASDRVWAAYVRAGTGVPNVNVEGPAE